METTENYYNTEPVSLQFSVDEHEMLCDALTCLFSCYDVIPFTELMDMPADSEMRKKYELIDSMRNRVYYMWSQRFETNG